MSTSITYSQTGNSYTDATTGEGHIGGGGHRTNLLPMLRDAIIEVAAAIAAAENAQAAYDAIASTVANAMETTSSTTFDLSSSLPTSKTFTTADNLDTTVAFVDGMNVKGISVSNPSRFFLGTVTSASGNTLVISVTYTTGTGSPSDWSIFAQGAPGTNVIDFSSYSEITPDPAADYVLFRDVSGNVVGKALISSFLSAIQAVRSNTTATLTAGYTATSYSAGTKEAAATYTPDPSLGNMQYAVNNGAHTLAPPANDCTMVIQYTNGASAGAVTTSGFTKVSGSFTTTDGDAFMCYITRVNGFSHLNIVRL